jgi:hypothetical protein
MELYKISISDYKGEYYCFINEYVGEIKKMYDSLFGEKSVTKLLLIDLNNVDTTDKQAYYRSDIHLGTVKYFYGTLDAINKYCIKNHFTTFRCSEHDIINVCNHPNEFINEINNGLKSSVEQINVIDTKIALYSQEIESLQNKTNLLKTEKTLIKKNQIAKFSDDYKNKYMTCYEKPIYWQKILVYCQGCGEQVSYSGSHEIDTCGGMRTEYTCAKKRY